jgi:two-component system cell cycle sensor histidine kinase/response regulator CckA
MDEMLINKTQRILVIDDNTEIHQDFRKILGPQPTSNTRISDAETALFGDGDVPPVERTRFRIDSAYQGQEALDLVKKAIEENDPYVLAFVDVRMPPGWDGVETLTNIWRCAPELQAVICTAYSDYSWDEMARLLVQNDNLLILKKPFETIEVLQIAHTLARKWALNRQARLRIEDLDNIVNQRTDDLRAANAEMVREINERKQVEAALQLSEEKFAKAFRASPLAMAIQKLDDGCYVDANENFAKLTGRTRDELLNADRATPKIWPDADAQSKLYGAIKQQRSVRNFKIKLKPISGDFRETLVSAEVFNLREQDFVLLIAEDITERLSLENQLRQAQKMEAVGHLASGVAHDFNNILTVIQGHVELTLAVKDLGSTVRASMRQVRSAAQRAAALTRQLLVFSRKQVMQLKVVDLNNVIHQLEQMLRRLISEQIELKYIYAAKLQSVFADPCNLEQILINLTVNARDAMPDGGKITVTTESIVIDEAYTKKNPEAKPGQFVRLSVADTGCGMDTSILSQIFEPFFTTKGIGKGTGLGLSTVYGIVKQLEGWIEVYSQPGFGSTFVVFLPATDKQLDGNVDHDSAPKPNMGKGTLLVVEDEAAVRQLAHQVLESHGYEILEASSGQEAIEVWRKNNGKIDLLLTDMIMPGGLSGRELAERLQREKKDLKVICMSGYSVELSGKSLTRESGFNFLAKPFDMSQLVQIVSHCLL